MGYVIEPLTDAFLCIGAGGNVEQALIGFGLKMQLNYDLWKAPKNRQPKIKPFPARPQKELASTLIRHRRRPITNPELL